MKTALSLILLLAATSPAIAQVGAGMGSGMAAPERQAQGAQPKRPAACAQAPDPAQCEANRKLRSEARAKAAEQCKDTVGPDRRKCMRDIMTAQSDCTKAKKPERCQETRKTYETCREKVGPAFRQCMREQAPGRPAPKSGAAPASKT